jgi:hypothetical protein
MAINYTPSSDQIQALLAAGKIRPDQAQALTRGQPIDAEPAMPVPLAAVGATADASAGGGFPHLASLGSEAAAPMPSPAPTSPSDARSSIVHPSVPLGTSEVPGRSSGPLRVRDLGGGITLLPKAQTAPAAATSAAPAKSAETEEQRRIRVELERRKPLTDAEQKEIDAAARRAQVEQEKLKALDAHATEGAAQRQKQAADFEAHQAQREAEVKAAQARAEAAVDDLARSKIDSNRLFRNMSTGQKAVGILATFFGAAGAAYREGSSNTASDALDKLIARDIDEQKTELDVKKNVVNARRGLLADAIAVTGDRAKAELMVQDRYLEALKLKGDALSAKYAAPEAQAAWEQERAKLESKQAEIRYGLEQGVRQRMAQERAAAAAAATANAKEQSARRFELLKESNKAAYDALKQAQQDGTAPPPWALNALNLTPDQAAGAAAVDPGNPLANVPKNLRDSAKGELKEHDAKRQANELLDDVAEQAKGRGTGDRVKQGVRQIPGVGRIVVGTSDAEQWNARIKALLTSQGLTSDTDTMEAIKPFYVQPGDTAADVKQKMDNAKRIVAQKHPTPTLDRYGSKPGAEAQGEAKKEDPYAKYRVK